MDPADYALLDADGVVVDVIVIDEDDPSSRAVLDALVAAKDGAHAPVKGHERVDGRRTGYGVPAIGRKKRADGTWRSDEFLERHGKGQRREYRDGDEYDKPTGRLLDENGEPRKGTALPAPSGPPPGAKPTS